MATYQLQFEGKTADIVTYNGTVAVGHGNKQWEFSEDLTPRSYQFNTGIPAVEFRRDETSGLLTRQIKNEWKAVTVQTDNDLASFGEALDIISDARKGKDFPKSLASKLQVAYKNLGLENKVRFEAPLAVNGKPAQMEIGRDGTTTVDTADKILFFSPEMLPAKIVNKQNDRNQLVLGDIHNGHIEATVMFSGYRHPPQSIPLGSETVKDFTHALEAMQALASRTASFPQEIKAKLGAAMSKISPQGPGKA